MQDAGVMKRGEGLETYVCLKLLTESGISCNPSLNAILLGSERRM